jgi:hypothetical protein
MIQLIQPTFSYEGSKIDYGSFGSVVQARIAETNEIVAIKRIKLEKKVSFFILIFICASLKIEN